MSSSDWPEEEEETGEMTMGEEEGRKRVEWTWKEKGERGEGGRGRTGGRGGKEGEFKLNKF